jgi:hypothetical protein
MVQPRFVTPRGAARHLNDKAAVGDDGHTLRTALHEARYNHVVVLRAKVAVGVASLDLRTTIRAGR